MKYFSMFSGIGGFELGIQRTQSEELSGQDLRSGEDSNSTQQGFREQQYTCIGYSEIDKYAIKVYERQFSGHKNFGDATNINPTDLPDFDLLVGGFPCQAFSIAGKRAGFDDTRGTLFFDIARILKEKQPRHLVLENVKGLLSHDSGRTFTTIIGVLTDLGYSVEWQVLNSKDFGVPQNRERVYIVGHLGNGCGRKVFPISRNYSEAPFIRTIRTGGASSYTEKHARDIIQINQPVHSNDRVYAEDGISPTLNTMQGGNRQPFVVNKIDRKNKQYELKDTEISGTLTATMWKGIDALSRTGVKELPRIRRLTPVECERLQGFPDNWTLMGGVSAEEKISDSQRYKMCGNAVTVNTVQAVMERLVAHVHSNPRTAL